MLWVEVVPMDEKRLCLAHEDSLKMLRFVRRRADLMLAPASTRVLFGTSDAIDPAGLSAALPEELFVPAPENPIDLRFDDDAARSRCSLVRASPGLLRLPDDAYLEVLTAEGDPACVCGGTVTHVLVESGPLALLSAAVTLGKAVGAGRLSRNAALVRLTGFAMELCGRYTRDPIAPLVGDVAHDIEPVSSVHELRAFLDESGGLHGVSLARMAASYANDGSGSTMETCWYGVFCLPPRLGGAHLARPLQNVPLDWPAGVADLVSHERMRPDFHWPQYETACEHQGGDHTSEQALEEDSRRARDYELCHIHYLPLTKKDARDAGSVVALLAQLFSIISPYETASFSRRARRMLVDEDVCAARRVLLAQLLPPRLRWEHEVA